MTLTPEAELLLEDASSVDWVSADHLPPIYKAEIDGLLGQREPWLTVDGTDLDGTRDSGFDHAPFWVFDANGQGYVSGPLPTRNAAEKLIAMIQRSGAAPTNWS
jgi:hypothetical protein